MEITSEKWRIELREIMIEDWEKLLPFLHEKKIQQFINLPRTKEGIENYIKKIKENNKTVRFVIILRETKEILGSIVLKNIQTKNKRAELWYRIGEKYEGKWLMKESLITLITYMFEKKKLERIQARIRTDNLWSIKISENLWFQKEWTARKYKKIKNKYYDYFLYWLLKSDCIKHSS